MKIHFQSFPVRRDRSEGEDVPLQRRERIGEAVSESASGTVLLPSVNRLLATSLNRPRSERLDQPVEKLLAVEELRGADALVAGTHGCEYPPILALQRVRRKLDPERLRGTVILVHIANLPSFLGRTVSYSQVDGKNLNRVYPGRPDGTLSERIADALYTVVIQRADVLVDMHGCDGNEALRPYVYTTVTGDPETDRLSRDLAMAFGLDTIVLERGWSPDPSAHVYTEWAARGLGKPAISTETGGLGSSSEELVATAERGVWNVLRHLRRRHPPGQRGRAAGHGRPSCRQ